MRRFTKVNSFLSSLVCCLVILTAGGAVWAQQPSSAPQIDKKEVLRNARKAYYSLSGEGLAEFSCSVTPDWSSLLAAERKADPAAADRAIQTLNQLHFNAAYGQDGNVHITHNTLAGQNQQMMDAMNQIFSGMEQMTSGFFDTWKLFMISPPFPAVESEYQIDNAGTQYRLSYKEDANTQVVTTIDPDFSINQLKVTTPEFNSAIWPRFTRTPKGLLFTSYDATYFSSKPGESTQLKVSIGYQEVSGLQLVRSLDLQGSYGGSPFSVQLTFSDCTVKKR